MKEPLSQFEQNDVASDLAPRPRGGFFRRIGIGLCLIAFGAAIGVLVSRPTAGQTVAQTAGEHESRTPGLLASVAGTIAGSFGDIFGVPSGGQAYEIALQDDTATLGNGATSNEDAQASASNGSTTETSDQPLVPTSSAASPKAEGSSAPAKTTAGTSSPAKKTAPASGAVPKACDVPAGGNASRSIVVNEVAWMGSPASDGVTASAASANEWLELKNVSGETVDLYGYRVQTADGDIFAAFTKHITVPLNGLALLERTDDGSVGSVTADLIYQGSLSNSGERVLLFDHNCGLVDDVPATAAWPAGDADTKKTMERDASGWHTSANAGGTPRAENSVPIVESAPAPQPQPTSTPPAPQPTGPTYALTVVRAGEGNGVLQTPDTKISCGTDCSESYPPNTAVTLTAYPENDSVFLGWSGGGCSGTGSCGMVMSGALTVTGLFGYTGTPQMEPVTEDPRYSGGGGGWATVSEVFSGSEGNADNEYVELYNPNDTAVSLTGWTIKKKSSTGSESSLVPASRLEGKTIPAKGYFLIVHEGSYQGSAPANATWAPSYSLAYSNNSVVLYDGAGTKVQEVHWDSVPVGESWTRSPVTGDTFVAASPTPQGSL